MGAFLAAERNLFSISILLLALLVTLFLQILSNFANDYGDYTSGVDGQHRTGPSRTVQMGLISASQMKLALIIFSILSFVSGILLLFFAFGEDWIKSIIFLLLGVGAIIAAIKYTVGKNPYGYAGLGDLFVMIFFGFVGVAGSYFLFSKSIDPIIFLPAYTCGILSVGVLNVNNIRDIESDKKSGKNSIPVRIGRKNAIKYHWVILTTAMLSILAYGFFMEYDLFDYGFIFSFPLFFIHGMKVTRLPQEKLDPQLKMLALSTLLFVLLFGLNVVIF
jgi:1,4-dihydroxy-2-naphthoate octaprenyltransferase